MKKPSPIHYLVALALVLAMIVIGLILLRVPGPIRTALVPLTPGPSPTPTAAPLLATIVVSDVSYTSDTSGCEAFDLGRRAWSGHGEIKMWPGEMRIPGCYAVPSDTEITITWEYWSWEHHADVAKFFLNEEDNVIGETIGGDSGNAVHDTYSVTTMFPADMPPSLLWVRGYHDGLAATSSPLILFVDKMAPTPVAPECQGFQLDHRASIGFGELTISPSDQYGRRCYAIPADTEITLTWKDTSERFNSGSIRFYLNDDFIDSVYGHSELYTITTTFPADMPPSQLRVEGWDGDHGMPSAPVIIFIER